MMGAGMDMELDVRRNRYEEDRSVGVFWRKATFTVALFHAKKGRTVVQNALRFTSPTSVINSEDNRFWYILRTETVKAEIMLRRVCHVTPYYANPPS
jgi:hypothetical protein